MTEYSGQHLEITIQSSVEMIEPIVSKLLTFAKANNITDDEYLFNLELTLRELLSNAIQHGSQGDQHSPITITFWIEEEVTGLRIKDTGPGLDWKNLDFTKSPQLEESGRGLLMVHLICDRLEFNPLGNEVTVYLNKNCNGGSVWQEKEY